MKKQELEKAKKELFNQVKKCYRLAHKDKEFIPGQTQIRYGGRVYDEKELMRSAEACLDFWLTAGRFAKQFEKEFAEFLGVKFAVLTNSGSSANLLAVSALTSPKLGAKRLKPQDEVITTACGFPTTLNPIIQNNLVPVFVDVEAGTYNIDVSKIAKAISKKTKAIFIPHTLGNPADLDGIMKLVKRHKLFLIEDNCDALGSKYKSRYTGTFGHISTCSFYPAHHITMGEGGAVLTSDSSLREAIVSFRDWGRDCYCEPANDNTCGRRFSQKSGKLPFGYDHKYVYSHIGYNLKITDLQAAIGLEQLKKLPGFIKARKINYNLLYKKLQNYEKYFLMPRIVKYADPSWFGFPILIKNKSPFSRQDIVNYLEKNKIATRMLFGGNLTRQPAYKDVKYRAPGGLKNSDIITNQLFWIGVYPGITEDMIEYISKTIERFIRRGFHEKD